MIKLPLVGPAYKMQAQSMSCQNCINWYPQTIEYPNGARVAALMPTPGLKKIFQGVTSAVRGLHVLSNGALLAVIGNKLYHSKANKFDLTEIGLISALGTVRFADNGRVALIVNGTYTYSLDLKKLTLTRLSGSAIPRSTHVVFLDGRFVFNKANTGQFHWSDLYSTNVNALSYATAESTPDNVTAIIEFNSTELWLFGSQSVERYYGTGSANAPFSRLSGGAMSFGCLAPDSIVSLSTGVIWLGVSEFGGSQIVMSAGGIPERISTHALEEEIASFSKTTDAMAYAYQMEGHVFYVISFPSANVTFCFDVSTGLWHQRSFANAQGLHERHRSQHHAYFNNMHIVGDYRNGKLYQLDNNIFTDDGELILRERTAQAVITDQKLTRFNQLQIICETGFYGEVKKEDPKPPIISCDGATNTVLMHRAVLINPNDSTIFPESEKTFVNGVEFERPPEYIEINPVISPSFPPPDGYAWENSIEIRNNSNGNVRLEQRLIPENQNLIRVMFSENPTVISFGENSIGVCLSEKSPTISCDGATNTADTGGIWGNVTMTVNGTLYEALLPIEGVLEIDNYGTELHNTFKNLSDQDLRIRITSTLLNSNDFGWGENTNPTRMVDFNTGVIEFCLSKSKQTISCEGATYRIFFEPAPLFNGEINWTIEFDGIAYDLGKVWAGDIVNNMPSHIKDKVWMDWDGFWVLENRDTLPHRFKLTPSAKPEIDPIQATWTEQNQSFMLNNDGSFVFCLAKKCAPTRIEIRDTGMDLPSNSFVSLTYSLSIPSENIEIVNKTILVNAQENGTAPVFREAIRQILNGVVRVTDSNGGVAHFQHYQNWLQGGDGLGIGLGAGEVTITLHNTNTPNPRADLMNFLQMYGETQYFSDIAPVVIHSCGVQVFPAF